MESSMKLICEGRRTREQVIHETRQAYKEAYRIAQEKSAEFIQVSVVFLALDSEFLQKFEEHLGQAPDRDGVRTVD